MKYSDQLADWLVEFGYTHCFYVGGGNIMHLVESLSRKLDCRAVIHEVAAGIAAEYFNETSDSGKALALVTAGPGMTNIVTAIAGAYLESRELLVLGGQVKTSDLANGNLRQNGIQEIDGVNIAKSICNASICMTEVWDKLKFSTVLQSSENGRKGPVFIEIPLDIQAKEVSFQDQEAIFQKSAELLIASEAEINDLVQLVNSSERPVILIGGGVSRDTAKAVKQLLAKTTIPVATSWNAMDRIDSEHSNYIGRPNTWGQRTANIIMQQSDLLIAIGSRLGMQQTGFNWQKFIPIGKVVQIDIDHNEIKKGHPIVDFSLAVDANDLLKRILQHDLGEHSKWLSFCKKVRGSIPLVEESANVIDPDYVSPHKLIQRLSSLTNKDDIIVPCSSGGAFTIMMQVFEQKFGQKVVTNKGLASMGYGLSGAIGASIANPHKRVVLVEGDGGFAQNLQEIGTAAINKCNLKLFLLDDGGYASIRMTQRSYFGGKYVGCDTKTGLGLPEWEALFKAWDVKCVTLDAEAYLNETYVEEFNQLGFTAFIVSINPEQTYFPKISSRVSENGSMESNPLHIMTPDLSEELKEKLFKFI